MKASVGFLLALTALGAAHASGQAPAPPKPLVMSAENLSIGDPRHQALVGKQADPHTVMPVDVVRYRLTFTNLRTDSVRSVQFNDPLPGGLRYMAGTAGANRADVTVEFSIDSGKSYAKQPMVEVVVDGQKVTRPAAPSLYTNVRWSINGWVKPNAQVTAEFQAQVTEAGSKP